MTSRAHVAVSRVLGLDIGGANLKAAAADGQALTVPFALWRAPQKLAGRLRSIVRRFRHHRLAVTMTAELCDCFATKREGVQAILDSVEQAAPETPIQAWSTQGRFVTVEEARAEPQHVAAANWHALATFAGRFTSTGPGLLVDIGSTTTDIIPLWQGRPVPRGLTDLERLASGELVYTGVRRTPVCTVLGLGSAADALAFGVAAEFFAAMHDAYLVLGKLPEEPSNTDTADGRPATCVAAHARLARMCCADIETLSWSRAVTLARSAFRRQQDCIARALQAVVQRLPQPPATIVLSGIGDFLARPALKNCFLPHKVRIVALKRKLSADVAAAACAYALAALAEEKDPRNT